MISNSIKEGKKTGTDVFSLLLKNHFLQYGFEELLIDKLIALGKTKLMQKGEQLVLWSNKCPLYFVLRGKLKLVDCGNSEEPMILDILRTGDFFGDLTLSEMVIKQQYVQAITNNTLICFYYAPDMKWMMEKNPHLAFAFATSVAMKLQQTEERNLWFTRNKSVKSRLAVFFRQWAKKDGVRVGDKFVLTNDMTISDIAGYISTSRQTVHCIINDFKKSGLLEINRKRIFVYAEW